MRIQYISDLHHFGGAEISFNMLADYMKKRGNIVSFAHKRGYEQNFNSINYFAGRNNYLRLLFMSIKCHDPIAFHSSKKLLKKMIPDIVDITNVTALTLAPLIAARKLKIPRLINIRDFTWVCPRGSLLKPNGNMCFESTWEKCRYCMHNDKRIMVKVISNIFPKPLSILLKKGMKNINNILKDEFIVANSNYTKDVLNRFGLSSTNINVIPPPIDCSLFKTSNHSENIVLWVGRFTENKGPGYFVKMAEYLKNKKNYSNFDFVMVGEGPLINKYKKNRNVKLTGKLPLDKVKDYYRKALTVVVTSISPETFGRVAPEAMACGKPVVAFARGGLKEIVIDGKNGFLVPIKDYTTLAEKTSLLIEDRDLSIKMGLNGRKHVERNYSLEIVGKKYENLYNTLLKRH